MFFENSLLASILECFLAFLFGVVVYYKYSFRYWKKKNIPLPWQPTIPLGHAPNIFPVNTHYVGDYIKYVYKKSRASGHKHVGFYQMVQPYYFALDLKYIKYILQRDFEYFSERGFYHNEKSDILSVNLLTVGGEKWQKLHSQLTPAFTSSKLRLMFDGLLKCALQLQDEIEKNAQELTAINVKTIFECFSIDVIGCCAFGLDCDSFKNPDGEFRRQGRKVLTISPLRLVKLLLTFSFQKIARWLNVRIFNKESTDFFVNVVKQTMKYRQENNVVRKDFIQLLMNLRNEEKNDYVRSLSVEQVAAQVFIFFAAGFETSSITATFCLYELCMNLGMQNRVREEIQRVLSEHNDKITYDAIMKMKYLEQVIDETLRKYPPVAFITRVCVKDYKIPDTETVIDKETVVVVPTLGIHCDSEYFPNPDLFDPERFSEQNKPNIKPFSYMPFGGGPRRCIGMRFGLMEVKVALVVLLQKYSFSLDVKTKLPMEFNPYGFTLAPKHDIFAIVRKV